MLTYTYTFFFIILTAYSAVLRHVVGQHIPGMLIIFLSTLFAIIFFHCLIAGKIKPTYSKLLTTKKLYLNTLIFVLLMWVGAFLIPIYYSPVIQVFSALAIASTWGALLLKKNVKTIWHLLSSLVMLMVLIAFYSLYFTHYSLGKFLILIVWTLLTGSAGYFYFASSYKLYQKGFSALEILATRFWLLFAFALFFVIKDKLYLQINGYTLGETLLVSFASLIIPIYCSQKSIEKIGPELHAVLIGLTPLMTFILENPFVSHSVNGIGYLSIVLAFAIGLRYFL